MSLEKGSAGAREAIGHQGEAGKAAWAGRVVFIVVGCTVGVLLAAAVHCPLRDAGVLLLGHSLYAAEWVYSDVHGRC